MIIFIIVVFVNICLLRMLIFMNYIGLVDGLVGKAYKREDLSLDFEDSYNKLGMMLYIMILNLEMWK